MFPPPQTRPKSPSHRTSKQIDTHPAAFTSKRQRAQRTDILSTNRGFVWLWPALGAPLNHRTYESKEPLIVVKPTALQVKILVQEAHYQSNPRQDLRPQRKFSGGG